MTRQILGRYALASAAVAAAVACSVATQRPPARTPDRIAFSHHLHTEQGLDCSTCHASLFDENAPLEKAIPRKADCAACHDVEDKAACKSCHRNPEMPGSWDRASERRLRFSHAAHGKRGVECDACHSGAAHWPDREGQERPRPGHAVCERCHKKVIEAGDCRRCHQRLNIDATRPERIFAHNEGFFDRHGVEAEGNADLCAECHEQSFCADCHAKTVRIRPSLRYPERTDRELIHRGDWITRHPVEARLGRLGCLKCHGNSFCESCHERSGVGPAIAASNPHANQPDWLRGNGASGHGRAARRRITDCAACHDQGPRSVCVRCHASGGINPHPPGWKPPMDRSKRDHDKMCAICHANHANPQSIRR